MSQALKAQEPSMEEILASIRRIIADDEAKPAAPVVAKSEPPLRPVLPLAQESLAPRTTPTTHDMMEALEPPRAATAPAPMFREEARAVPEIHEEPGKPAIDPLDALEAEIAATAMARPADEPEAIEEDEPDYHAAAAVPQPRETREERWEEPVVAETALVSAQTSDAVNNAFNALAHSVMAQNTERLDEMARAMLRPMLKAWLDDNLPSIVERLVRAEIERVARGR